MRIWNWIKGHKAWTSVIVVLIWSFIDIGDVSIGLVYGFFVGAIKLALYWRNHKTRIAKEEHNAYMRRHSVFGDYVPAGKEQPPDDVLTDIGERNALWMRYTNEISGKWGLSSIPTEKGFEEWLAKRIKEVSNGK